MWSKFINNWGLGGFEPPATSFGDWTLPLSYKPLEKLSLPFLESGVVYCCNKMNFLHEALNPNTATKRLRKLVETAPKDIKCVIAQNPNTPIEILLELIRQCPKAFLRNPILDLLILSQPSFFDELPDHSFECLVHNGELNEELAPLFVNVVGEYKRRVLASHPKTPISILRSFAKGDNKWLRRAVASNPSTPNEVLELLAKDDDVQVCVGVAANRNASVQLLNTLYHLQNQNITDSN